MRSLLAVRSSTFHGVAANVGSLTFTRKESEPAHGGYSLNGLPALYDSTYLIAAKTRCTSS
jgi:hypothetical protein